MLHLSIRGGEHKSFEKALPSSMRIPATPATGHGVGTAAVGPLTGVGQKYTDAQLIALLHSPDIKMTAGAMTPADLKQDEMEELSAYLRQLH